MQDNNEAAPPRFRPVPWTALDTPADVELWIAEHNLALQEHVGKQETGYGVCFTLAAGGELYMQTGEGAIVLDLTPDAAWVTPLIEAVGQVEAPKGSLWVLPDDKLVQLIIGLSSLVASTTLVVGHAFGRRRL
jgi:hypothetical protein